MVKAKGLSWVMLAPALCGVVAACGTAAPGSGSEAKGGGSASVATGDGGDGGTGRGGFANDGTGGGGISSEPVAGSPAEPGSAGETGQVGASGDADWLAKCPLNGKVVEHGNGGPTHVDADETWAGDGTVHWVKEGDLYVGGESTLTIEPCAIIKVDSEQVIDAIAKSHIVARGTAAKPIIFVPAQTGTRWWGLHTSARIDVPGDPALDLAYVLIAQTGDVTASVAAITTVAELRLQHVTILDAASTGIEMMGGGFSADSDDVTIHATAVPISISINNEAALRSLPSGSYGGNVRDEIEVGSMTITQDSVLHDVGVPIAFGSTGLNVRPAVVTDTPVKLTLEPGVELSFDGGLLQIGYGPSAKAQGTLEALGTQDKPIRFTGAKQEPGSWRGIWLANAPASQLAHVIIEYAGDDLGDGATSCIPMDEPHGAALSLGYPSGAYVPDAQVIQDSIISQSAGLGILSLWVAADGGPDLTASNEFPGLAACTQSKPLATKPVSSCWTFSCLVP